VFREEVVEQSDNEVRTRHGSGQAPSSISLDLKFVKVIRPTPPALGLYEIPPMRDLGRVARVDRAFARMDALEATQRRQ
jgi:hypothetical protein